MRTLALFSALVAVSLLHAQAPAPEVSPELKKLNGYWKPMSVVADGEEQMKTPEAKASITLKVKDGEYTLFEVVDAKNNMGRRISTADLKLDPATKTFELTVKQGYRKGEKVHGIYELTSTEFKLCYGPEKQPRPTKFEAPKGTEYFCETWVPEKK